MLRVQDRAHGWVTVTLLERDPLLGTVPRPAPIRTAADPLVIGQGEDGDPVEWNLAEAAHACIQGTTGGGKSIATYSLLSQLRSTVDVAVTGSDITALTLAPWDDRTRPGIPPPALGTTYPNSHLAVVEKLCKIMDARIGAMPRGRDSVDISPDCPVIVCVLEETPGLYRFLKLADSKLYDRLRAAVGRLLGEGRKAGIRLLIIAQRADADILGGYERGQCSHRISFRVDTMDAVRMLHPDASPELAAEHASAPAGVALVSMPGRPLLRLKAPYVPFREYVDLITPGSAA
jgi:S-DNA-T family DNA segregation ATPase FtsK/SpoIIIE